MFQRMRMRPSNWLKRYQQRRIEQLLQENRSLMAQLLEASGGKAICLSPAQKNRLVEKGSRIDPKWRKSIAVLEDESVELPSH